MYKQKGYISLLIHFLKILHQIQSVIIFLLTILNFSKEIMKQPLSLLSLKRATVNKLQHCCCNITK